MENLRQSDSVGGCAISPAKPGKHWDFNKHLPDKSFFIRHFRVKPRSSAADFQIVGSTYA